jgi:hypothetical protein
VQSLRPTHQVYGAGQWLQEKHGAKSRRNWRKLHLAVDADSGRIVAHTLTDQDTDDPSQVAPLLDQIDGEIGQFTADGAYDGAPTYRTVLRAIAMPHRLSSHHAQRRHKAAIRDHPASGTATSRRSQNGDG